jgi:hypothetical protein
MFQNVHEFFQINFDLNTGAIIQLIRISTQNWKGATYSADG